jgi:hypothetical protein
MRSFKRVSILVMIVFIITGLLAGCGPDVTDKEDEEQKEVVDNDVDIEEETGDEGIKVEEGFFDVSITIPPGMVDEMTEADETEELKEEAGETGDVEVIENEDGSLTYKMSRATHNKMMQEIREGIDDYVREILEGDDFPTVENIEYDNDLTSVVITVTSEEEFKSGFDAFIVFGLGLQAMFYQVFDGVDPDNINVVIDAKDQQTGEVFGTTVYPEDLDDQP